MSIDIKGVRALFPALDNYVWFQNGGVSITPAPVAQEHARLMAELLARGPMHIVHPDEEYPRRRQTMERLARYFGVPAGELALMRGVSEGFHTVVRAIDWQRGDRIVISDNEEAALLLPSLHLRDRCGVEVAKLPMLEDDEELLAAAAEALTPRTRLMALSHVTTDMGFRFPAPSLCALARERGIWSFLDLAHSAGVVPMDLRSLGCDFAGILSYKWMYAPYASGLLWVRSELIDQLPVTFAGGRGEKRLDFERDEYELHDTAERFQYGPWSWPLVHAWAHATDWLLEIGPEAIWERTCRLTAQLKEGIGGVPGAELFTPASPCRSAALVSFGVAGWKGADLAAYLRREHNIIIKPQPHTREGLRASLPFFLREDEIELLLTALGRAAA
ncbi:aminotransferase class V-fold PLP-dependent enzyme [Candidatus Latescibacterota bacterium]